MKLGDLPAPDQPALIGVSGGRDSVALLHALAGLGYRRLLVCHFNHHLRPESSDDARFVERLAKRHRLDVDVGGVHVAHYARDHGISIETAARESRYRYFAQMAARSGTPTLLLAHHADDQVETCLFNLFRGSGTGGLGAMCPSACRLVDGVELHLVRPLLDVWREEIDGYVTAHGLDYLEDPSNYDTRHVRNRLRHEIIPLVSQVFGRDVRRAIWRAADILRAEDEWLTQLATPLPAAGPLCTRKLLAAPTASQRRQLHEWLQAHQVPDIGFQEVEAVRSLLYSRRAKVNLPGGHYARRRERRLFIEPPSVSATP